MEAVSGEFHHFSILDRRDTDPEMADESVEVVPTLKKTFGMASLLEW